LAPNVASVPSSQGLSYEGSATFGGGTLINYNGAEPTDNFDGGLLEATSAQGTGSKIYSLLWEYNENSGVDTYLGYFTFNGANDELDFTSTVAAVPEPSTYGLLAASGLLALALRRQFGSLHA
jgi:hypothetical protein